MICTNNSIFSPPKEILTIVLSIRTILGHSLHYDKKLFHLPFFIKLIYIRFSVYKNRHFLKKIIMLNFYSYNISESLGLFDEITSFFLKKKKSILFLQELPKVMKDDNVLSFRFQGKVDYFWHCGLLILITPNLKQIIGSFAKVDADRHFLAVSCPLGTFVNVHMNPLSTKKDRIVSYSKEVNKILSSGKKHIIVGGDFNGNPFDESLSSSEIWYAKRSSKELPKTKGFVNLFWNLIKLKRNCEPRGTITPSGMHHEPMDKAVFDQFIMKKDFSDKTKSFGILEKIGQNKISVLNNTHKSTIKGTPHWPIYISIGGLV